MIELIIDSEFKDLLPPLSDEKRAQLEENILRDGIQDPLKVWSGVLIDGHNRYEIAQAHGLEFATTEMQFDSRDDVKFWMITNQFGRRDLTVYERSLLALKLKPVIAAKAKENQQLSEGRGQKGCQISDNLNIDTKKEIARAAGVSHDTIAKVEKIEAKATPEVKAALKSGEISINQAFKEIKRAEKDKSLAEGKAVADHSKKNHPAHQQGFLIGEFFFWIYQDKF